METVDTTIRVPVLLSSNPDNLAKALEGKASVTVEAEYGDRMVEGSLLSLGHHGPRKGNPPPCERPNELVNFVQVVGINHLDLDSIGGVLSILGLKPEVPAFWKLAGFVDVNGAHKLSKAPTSSYHIARLWAWWAWADAHVMKADINGEVTDVTEYIHDAATALWCILSDEERFLKAGIAFMAEELLLNQDSFKKIEDGVIFRESTKVVNHLYVTPSGEIARACVSWDPATHRVTVSVADPTPGVICNKIVRELWGPDAGGHEGVAGGPYSGLPREAADHAFRAMQKALWASDNGVGFAALPRVYGKESPWQE